MSFVGVSVNYFISGGIEEINSAFVIKHLWNMIWNSLLSIQLDNNNNSAADKFKAAAMSSAGTYGSDDVAGFNLVSAKAAVKSFSSAIWCDFMEIGWTVRILVQTYFIQARLQFGILNQPPQQDDQPEVVARKDICLDIAWVITYKAIQPDQGSLRCRFGDCFLVNSFGVMGRLRITAPI